MLSSEDSRKNGMAEPAGYLPDFAVIHSVSKRLPAFAVRPQILQRDGAAWRVVFDQQTFYLRDAVGVRYLAALLANPRRKLSAADLAGARDVRPEESVTTPALDAWRRITELSQDLEDAHAQNDLGRCHCVRTALEGAQDELASLVDTRDPAGDLERERARKSVRNAIHRVIQRIRRLSADLADHLADTIRTGSYCVYRPDPYSGIEWQCDVGAEEATQERLSSRNAA